MATTYLVTQLTGQAWVRGSDGSLTPLREGMTIPANAEIVTADGASVQIQAEGQPAITIGGGREVQLGASTVEQDIDPSAASIETPADGDAARVLAALDEGVDPFALLDPTAAVDSGNTGGTAPGSGSSFNRLAQIIETTTPLGLEYPRPDQ